MMPPVSFQETRRTMTRRAGAPTMAGDTATAWEGSGKLAGINDIDFRYDAMGKTGFQAGKRR
jgi:hypothetical protein